MILLIHPPSQTYIIERRGYGSLLLYDITRVLEALNARMSMIDEMRCVASDIVRQVPNSFVLVP